MIEKPHNCCKVVVGFYAVFSYPLNVGTVMYLMKTVLRGKSMTNTIVTDEIEKDLTDDELVGQFTKGTKSIFSVQQNLEKAERDLGNSKALEDFGFILKDVQEITSEQKAMLQLSANLSVAGTSEDAHVPESIIPLTNTEQSQTVSAFESYKLEAAKHIGSTSESFRDIWYDVSTSANCLKAIHSSARNKIETTGDFIISKCIMKDSVIDCRISQNDIPQILWGATDLPSAGGDKDYYRSLSGIKSRLFSQMSSKSKDAISRLDIVLTECMSKYGKSSFRVSQETYKETKAKLLLSRSRIANEDVSTSPDGLIVDVQLTDGYWYEEGTDNNKPCFGRDQTQPLPPVMSSFITNQLTISSLLADLNTNKQMNDEVLLLIHSVTNAGRIFEIARFTRAAQLLLDGNDVLSSTRQQITEHCQLFLSVVNEVVTELRFMLFVQHFIIAHTELIKNIVESIPDVTNSEELPV